MLEFFYRTHDPTTKNQQGKDVGTRACFRFTSPSASTHIVGASEYRSAIFYHTPEQLEIAKRVTEEVQKKHFDPIGTSAACLFISDWPDEDASGKKIATELVSAGEWWDAEDYHQKYLFKNPDGYQCPNHRLHW